MQALIERFLAARHAQWSTAIVLFLLCTGMIYYFYHFSREYAIGKVRQHSEEILLEHRAKHAYIEEVQKPVIYKLKDEGKLYDGFFSPELMSFTFIANNMYRYYQKELHEAGKPLSYYRLASDNPRNPLNRADAFESELLRRFNAGELTVFEKIVEREGEAYLYKALPVAANKLSCMRCHSTPDVAPADMMLRYGREAGFNEKIGHIRAIISLEVPLKEQMQEADRFFRLISFVMAAVFLFVYAGIHVLIKSQKRFILLKDEREREMLAHHEMLRQSNKNLEYLATTDELTQLGNRRKFIEDISFEMESSQRYDTKLSLIMFDLDYFKQINDRLGHDRGDRVLQTFAALLVKLLRKSDRAYRIGGEEFTMLANHTGLEEAKMLAERIRTEMGQLRVEGLQKSISLSVSAGVAIYEKGETFESFLKRTDKALYRAKAEGRDRVVVAEKSEGHGA